MATVVKTVPKQFEPFAFKPGQSGNPAGRPKGSKHKLGEAFVAALYASFEEHGAATIEKVRLEKPDQYLKVVASVIPQEINHTVEDYEQLSDDDLYAEFLSAAEIIKRRIASRDEGNQSAGAIGHDTEQVPD